jgi:hypothetical protein
MLYAYAQCMMLLFLCLRGFALSYHQYFMLHGYDVRYYNMITILMPPCYNNNSIVCIALSMQH